MGEKESVFLSIYYYHHMYFIYLFIFPKRRGYLCGEKKGFRLISSYPATNCSSVSGDCSL